MIDWDKHTIVGTSTTLEKRYLRLTSVSDSGLLPLTSARVRLALTLSSVRTQEPDPSTIRPLPVLIQTLELLKQKWRKELNYPYICDQFKSVRQDLTVCPTGIVLPPMALD